MTDTATIQGTTLDASRTKGRYESAAEQALGTSLIHHVALVTDGKRKRIDQMWRLYSEFGWSLEDIGKAWGVSKQLVHQVFQKEGLTMRKAWETPKKKRPQ